MRLGKSNNPQALNTTENVVQKKKSRVDLLNDSSIVVHACIPFSSK